MSDDLPRAILQRQTGGDWGTPGHLSIAGSDWSCDTLELPDRNNVPDKSRINPGAYRCEMQWSDHFKRMIYHVLGVPGHGAIEIHGGNWAGDKDMGLHSDVKGCALLGRGYGRITPYPEQTAILHSWVTVTDFENQMGAQPFVLEVKDVQNTPADTPRPSVGD